jgi:hypothetical protein
MPTNDITYVRFYGETEGDIPPVTPWQLGRLTDELHKATVAVLRLSLGDKIAVDMIFAASPRRGCLEFCFQPQFQINGVVASGLSAAVLGGLTLDFLWRFVVGDRGIIDLIASRRKNARVLEGAPLSPEEKKFTVSMSAEVLKNKDCLDAVERLLSAARSGEGAVQSITVEIRDEGEVELIRPLDPEAIQEPGPEIRPPSMTFERIGRDVGAAYSGVAGRAARVRLSMAGADEEEDCLIYVNGDQRIPESGSIARYRHIGVGGNYYVSWHRGRPKDWGRDLNFYEVWLGPGDP